MGDKAYETALTVKTRSPGGAYTIFGIIIIIDSVHDWNLFWPIRFYSGK